MTYFLHAVLPSLVTIGANMQHAFSGIESTTFFRNQNLFISPEIESFWNEMRSEMNNILVCYKNINVCGDGRSDSPGHSARYCTYVLMENIMKLVIDLEILDCRETEGVSTRMEKEGLMRLLKKTKLHLVELTTDASSSVIKGVRDLKPLYDLLKDLYHSLDTWHKSKALRKALVAAAKNKENEDLTIWIDSIVNHFWHCSKHCEGDLKKLKVNILSNNFRK